MSAVSRFFSIPELRLSLSEHVDRKAGLSVLSRVDRLSYFLVSPLLYTNIELRLKDIVLIAQAFTSRPDIACRCLTLRIYSPDYEDVRYRQQERKSSFKAKCQELAFVLRVLSEFGRLRSFEWLWEPGWLDDDEVPQLVWDALVLNATSLRKIDISLSQTDGKCWNAFSPDAYSRVQSLRVDLTNAHGWNCTRFHEMLHNAEDLVSLSLVLPTCCGPQEFALSSTHRNLRSLSFHGSVLAAAPNEDEPITKDFLKRHSQLEFLDLCCQTRFEVDDQDLPNLCAISVEHSTLNFVPNLFSSTANRHVKALRLTRMPHLTMDTVFTLCSSVTNTLKYLHMDSSIFSFRANLLGFSDLLNTLPALVELRLVAESVCAFQLQHKLCEDDLVEFLTSLSEGCAPSLVALSFADSRGKLLTQKRMECLPPVPPTLKQLAWDVMGTRYLYDIVERSHRSTRAVLASSLPVRRRLWVHDAVMDHFGPEADGW